MEQYFHSFAEDKQNIILNSVILVYECEGTESEIKEWFQTINISGIELTHQELLNAVYSGPFVSLGKEEFSNSQNANIQKWEKYINAKAHRQEYWERALEWVSKGKEHISLYMSAHRFDNNINEVKTYFNTVLDWASTIFTDIEKEMRGLDWGRIYETYHKKAYDPVKVSSSVQRLYADPYVKSRKGIFEFILGGEVDTKLLEVRVFDEVVKRTTYEKQTVAARESGTSNCPNCAIGHDANKARIYPLDAMDADHVSAWSKGGATSPENCQMLCKPHNQAKGNR